jgi:hypothetical protein
MSTTTGRQPRAISADPEAEQQPWRTASDRAGWRTVALGKRHPGTLLREVEASFQRHAPSQSNGADQAPSTYRQLARLVVEPLLAAPDPEQSSEAMRRLIELAYTSAGKHNSPLAPSQMSQLAREIHDAWRRYTAP